MTESNLNGAAEKDLGYGQLFAVLLRRRFWFLSVFCSVLSVSALLTLMAKPTYQSSMQMLVEPDYPKREDSGQGGQPANSVETDYATQLNLMRSSQLIQKAVDWLRPVYPAIDAEEIKQSLVLAQLTEAGKSGDINTNIVQADYTDNDPVKTRNVLAVLQQVYQDYNLEQQKLRLTDGLAFVDQQLPRARQSVIEAERALEEFRENHNLVDPQQQASEMAETLNATQQERRIIRMQRQDLQAQYDVLQKQTASSPINALLASRLSQSTRYQALLNDVQETELGLARQRQRFTASNPVIKNLVERRQDQLALLQQEMGRLQGKDATQLGGMRGPLLTKGQLGMTDLNLASQFADVQKQLSALQGRDLSLAKTEHQLRTELNQFPNLIADYNRLQPEIEIRRNTLQQLLASRQQLGLEINRGGFNWQVVEAPHTGQQTGPKVMQNLLMGVVVGLMLGGVTAFVREAMDDAVHTSDELSRKVALPLLGMIPELPQAEVSEPLINNLSFRKPQAIPPSTIELIQWPLFREALDLIYKNIQLLTAFPISSLVVTSALAGEGKSTLALGLAMSAARLNQRVLLIDADLRRPSLHKQLNLPNEGGLSTLLTSDTAVPNLNSIPPSDSNIDILTAGPTPADPVKLLSSQRMKELMAAFEQTYDLVLLDVPPVLGMVDAIQAASVCNGVVMVGRIGRVSQTELSQATAMLSKFNVIGVVANGDSGPTYYSYPTSTEKQVSPSFRLCGL